MKTLQDNPKITLIFSYTYENVNFKVTLPGQSVKAYTNIPWYGPLYLYAYYGGRGAVQNAPVLNSTNRTYTVVKGDTLTGIAIKLNTTVKSLVSLNNIKDPDKLKIGQVLKY
ncbi:MAG: LysM peptidoglycan-binding domain-containing protein [Lachnospiraceae bacterium]|nr:LysM peptidoglycan-binding domain-containing protein [Lachnospiraceae bacterium]